MNVTLEQIIQITSIITFFSMAIIFFVKIGEYKSLINNEIKTLKENFKDCQSDIEKLEKKIEEIEKSNDQVTSLLIEVKTKLEFFMAASGIFKNNENFKK